MTTKRLLIDLNLCDDCGNCTVKCSQFYKPQLADHGILTLREMATFLLICRRCENPSCTAACRFEALERQPDGVMKRYNMRCVSCKCCSHACPFGTIYPDTVPYYVTNCDFCLSQGPDYSPDCLTGCEQGAITYAEVMESEKDGIFVLNDHLAVKAPRWAKQAV